MADRAPEHTRPSASRAFAVAICWTILWFGPIALILMLLGSENVFFQEAAFFSKSAVVTFGGAYAVLAYVAQQAVENYGWLTPGEMLDGLGLAETTPGTAHSGLTVCRLPCGLPQSWRSGSDDCRDFGSNAYHVGYICPLFPLDLPRRTIR